MKQKRHVTLRRGFAEDFAFIALNSGDLWMKRRITTVYIIGYKGTVRNLKWRVEAVNEVRRGKHCIWEVVVTGKCANSRTIHGNGHFSCRTDTAIKQHDISQLCT